MMCWGLPLVFRKCQKNFPFLQPSAYVSGTLGSRSDVGAETRDSQLGTNVEKVFSQGRLCSHQPLIVLPFCANGSWPGCALLLRLSTLSCLELMLPEPPARLTTVECCMSTE